MNAKPQKTSTYLAESAPGGVAVRNTNWNKLVSLQPLIHSETRENGMLNVQLDKPLARGYCLVQILGGELVEIARSCNGRNDQ